MTNLRRGPSGPIVETSDSPNGVISDVLYGNGKFSPMFAAGEFPEIFVSTLGNDSNSGTSLDTPFKTIEAAIRLSNQSAVKSSIFLSAGEHDGNGLRTPRPLNKTFKLVGVEFTENFPSATVTSYVGSSRTLTFSPSPGWTPDALVGMFAQFVSGPSDVGSDSGTKLIISNTANSFDVSYTPYGPGNVAPQAGDVYHVVEPAAKLIGLADSEIKSSIVGGNAYNSTDTTYGISDDACEIQNIDIVSDEVGVPLSTSFSGSWMTYGIRFVNLVDSSWDVNFAVATINAGAFYNFFNVTGKNGWGLCALNKLGTRAPVLTLDRSTSTMYMVVGRVVLKGASTLRWMGGSAKDDDSSFPHGTICSLDGSHVYQLVTNNVGRFLVSSGIGQYDFVCEAGFIELDSPVTHLGTGGFIRGRYGCNWKIAKNPVISGSGAGVFAELGAQGRISGADGSTLGPATVGSSPLNPITRAAGAWAVGEDVIFSAATAFAACPKDFSNIYRTS